MYPIKEIINTEKDSETTCTTAMNGKETINNNVLSFGKSGDQNRIAKDKKQIKSIFSSFDWKESLPHFLIEEINSNKHGAIPSKVINNSVLSEKWKERLISVTGKSLHKCTGTSQPKPKAPHISDIEEIHNVPRGDTFKLAKISDILYKGQHK